MKRLTLFLLAFWLGLATILGMPNLRSEKAYAIDPMDQKCEDYSEVRRELVGANGQDYQMFIPTVDRLRSIALVLAGNEFAGNSTVTINIVTDDLQNIGSASITPTLSDSPEYRTWTLASAVTVTPGAVYRIALQPVPGKSLYWYTGANKLCDGRDETRAIQGAWTNLGFDFDYRTFGYNAVVPVQEAPPSQTQTTPSTTTSTSTSTTATASGDAPAAQTDSSIKAPSELKIENVAGAAPTSVKLTWKKSSTTDITGYKVFRSTEEKKSFKEIGKTIKEIVEYSDATVTASTKYYYFVRAYKDKAESASSSTVNITTEAPAAVATVAETPAVAVAETKTETATPEKKSTNWLLIALIALLAVLIAALTYLEIKAKKTGQKVSPKILWPLVSLIVINAAVLAWVLFSADEKETVTPAVVETTEEASAVYTPKHEDWAVYRSDKYKFNISTPLDYLLAETGDKSINLTKGDKVMVELYSSAGGTQEDLSSTVALYTDDSKGYMTGGKQESVTIAETTGTKVSGTFGKNGGNKMDVFDGVKGSTTIFIRNDRVFRFNSYDNADPAALTIFADIAADLVF